MCLHAAYLKACGRFSANSSLKAYGFRGLIYMAYCDIMMLSDHSLNCDPVGVNCKLQTGTKLPEIKECHCKCLPSNVKDVLPTTQAAMWINDIRDVINVWLFASWISWRHIVAKWLAQGQIRIVAWLWTFKSDSHLAVKSLGDFVLRFSSAFPDLQNTIRAAKQYMCLP